MIILISMVLLVGFGQFSGVDYQRPYALVYSFVVFASRFCCFRCLHTATGSEYRQLFTSILMGRVIDMQICKCYLASGV